MPTRCLPRRRGADLFDRAVSGQALVSGYHFPFPLSEDRSGRRRLYVRACLMIKGRCVRKAGRPLPSVAVFDATRFWKKAQYLARQTSFNVHRTPCPHCAYRFVPA